MTLKSLFVLFLSLALLVAGPAFADPKSHEACQVRMNVVNPSDVSGGFTAINIASNASTDNATFATAYGFQDNWITNVPMKLSNLKVLVDVAPAGVTSRTVTVSWDPPGATGLTNSVVTGTTPSTRGSFGCTITGTATSCSDVSGRGVRIPVGSTVALRMANTGAVAAAAEIGISYCMTPSPQPGLN